MIGAPVQHRATGAALSIEAATRQTEGGVSFYGAPSFIGLVRKTFPLPLGTYARVGGRAEYSGVLSVKDGEIFVVSRCRPVVDPC